MTLLIELINTVIYILCVINIGELYFCYRRKQFKYRKLILSMVILCATIVMAYAGTLISVITHMLCIVVVLICWFEEDWKTLWGFYIHIFDLLKQTKD